jgi:hypothetical protein
MGLAGTVKLRRRGPASFESMRYQKNGADTRASRGASCFLTSIGSRPRLNNVLATELPGPHQHRRTRLHGGHGAEHSLPTMPPHTFGMGVSVVPKEAEGERTATPTICQRLLLPWLQAQRGGVYFGETRG